MTTEKRWPAAHERDRSATPALISGTGDDADDGILPSRAR